MRKENRAECRTVYIPSLILIEGDFFTSSNLSVLISATHDAVGSKDERY